MKTLGRTAEGGYIVTGIPQTAATRLARYASDRFAALRGPEVMMTVDSATPDARDSIAVGPVPAKRPSRIESLDALRGITIAVMILVNTSGDGAHTYRFLSHSPWNGCTLADVVFPCFLLIIGVSLVISVSGRLRRGARRAQILRQALKRSAILFALGLAVNTLPHFDWHTLRIFGVLQRIAICSFIGPLLYLWLRPKTLLVVCVVILLGYWVLLRWVPVPGLGMPGVQIPFVDPYANMPAWLDRHLLPAAHLYHHSFYDPEGLLSTLPAIATTLLGVLCGVWLQWAAMPHARARGLLVAALTCLIGGLLWSHWFPFNKRLWTSSFVLWNGGISLLTFWLLFWYMDLRRRGARLLYPALVFGTNSLAVYVLSEFLAAALGAIHLRNGVSLQQWLYQPLAAGVHNRHIAALTYAVLFVALCFVPMLVLYRRRVYIKV